MTKERNFFPLFFRTVRPYYFVAGTGPKALTGSDGQSLFDRCPNSMLHERLFAKSSPAGIDSIELWSCGKSKAYLISPDDLTTQEF
jgi:hypothetical protein